MSNSDNSGLLIVTDFLEARPGMEETLRAELLTVVEAERNAGMGRGLIAFDLHRDQSDPARFLTYEVWESRQRFDEFHHKYQPPELASFLARADQWLTQPVERIATFWDVLGDDTA